MTIHPPEFLVYAPPYSYTSAGCRALYRLCHILNECGATAAIYPWFEPRLSNPDWNTPFYDGPVGDIVVIYPETVLGNPLWANKVVRWMLNYPGVISGEQFYADEELVFVYLPAMLPRVSASTRYPLTLERVLNVGVIDPKHVYSDSRVEKTLDCIFTYKGAALKERFPPKFSGPLVSVEDNSPSLASLGELLRKTQTLYSYDHTSTLLMEAVICGCDVYAMHTDGSWLDPRACGCRYNKYWPSDLVDSYATHFNDNASVVAFIQCVKRQWPDGLADTLFLASGFSDDLSEEGVITYSVDDLGSLSNPFVPPVYQEMVTMFNHEIFRVRGWAFDTSYRAKLGGVELVIDRKTYRVHYGCARPDVVMAYNERAYLYCGFQSAIRGAALGVGIHEMCLRFISHNLQSYAETPSMLLAIVDSQSGVNIRHNA